MMIYVIVTWSLIGNMSPTVMLKGFKSKEEAVDYVEETLGGEPDMYGWWIDGKHGCTYVIESVKVEG